MERKISATINTDASFSYKYKIGSFAYWIRCESKKWSGADMLRGPIEDVTEAELKAICNALFHLVEVRNPDDLKLIYINTDNIASVKLIEKKRYESKKKKYRDVLTTIHTLLEGKEVIIRYVPAHTIGDTKRTQANNKLDEIAKKYLRNHIKQMK